MRSPRTAAKSYPCSLQLEKARAQQRRPSAGKKKKKNCKVKLLPLETKSFYTSIDGVISEKDLAPTYHYVAEDIEAQRG